MNLQHNFSVDKNLGWKNLSERKECKHSTFIPFVCASTENVRISAWGKVKTMIKGIIFDLDGVLVSTDTLSSLEEISAGVRNQGFYKRR